MTAGRKVFSPQFFAASAHQPKGGVFQNLIYPRHSPAKEIDMARPSKREIRRARQEKQQNRNPEPRH